MNVLPLEKKIAVISALVEGNSIRSVSRITGVDRNTINSLLLRTGDRCAQIMDAHMRDLRCSFVQCDEIWCFVGKKDRRVRQGDSPDMGSQWVFVAMDEETKLIPIYTVGKRTKETTEEFLFGLQWRLNDDRFQITTDGYVFYNAIQGIFAGRADHAKLIKMFGNYSMDTPEARYSPPGIAEVVSRIVEGRPDEERICTSHVERQNLTYAYGDAALYTADQCVQQEAVASESRNCLALRLLQLLPRSFVPARDSRHGSRNRGPHLVYT